MPDNDRELLDRDVWWDFRWRADRPRGVAGKRSLSPRPAPASSALSPENRRENADVAGVAAILSVLVPEDVSGTG
jgi:hypothetical protein